MKIAMLTNNYRPFVGGVPVSVERQAQELVKLGHEVTVFAPIYGDTKEERQDVIRADADAPERVVRYRTRRKKMGNGMVYPAVFPTEIMRVFANEIFDVIHVHHPMFAGPLGVRLGKKYNVPVIFTCHTRYEDYLHYIPALKTDEHSPAYKRKAVRWIQEKVVPAYIRWFSNQCDLVLAPSAGMRQILRGYGMASRSAVFPTGLEDEFFKRNDIRAAEIRREYGKGKRHLLVTVSRLEREKNYGFLLRGIADIRRRVGDSFHVPIIGDGSQRSELKVRASLLGIQDMVTFLGNVPNEEVKDYLNAADLFLFASTSETQGIVLAEAFAAGKPVVGVRAVGTDDIIEDGVNGFLTEEDEEMWACRAAELLESEDQLNKMGRAALASAENYRASTLAIYEEMLYNQCVGQKRTALTRTTVILERSRERKEERGYAAEKEQSEHPAMVIQ